MDPRAPTGNTSAAAKAYYQWLYAHYFAAIPAERTSILWSGPFYIFLFIFVLAAFLFLYAWYFNRVHRKQGELYGVLSFAGVILERIGPVGLFTIIVSIAIVIWAAYFWITQILYGVVY